MQGADFSSRLEEIARDRVSGAREILGRLLNLVRAILEGQDAAADPLAPLDEVARRVLAEQSTMAPLLALLDELFRAGDAGGRPEMIGVLDRWSEEHRDGLERTVAGIVGDLEGVRRVATLSWSSTVAGVLASCRGLEVLVAESRPGAEGCRMATRLQSLGHRVTFAPDAAFPGLLHDVEILLLGADALTPQGLVNKVGSLPAAREMSAGKGRTLALVDRSKVLGPDLASRLRVHPEPKALVWDNAPDGIEVRSMLFECVPLDLVDTVAGPGFRGTPQEVLSSVAGHEASPRWAAIPPCAEGSSLEPGA